MQIFKFSLLLVLLFQSCATQNKEAFDLIIQNGNIIDLETGNIQTKNIFITNGRILKIEQDYNPNTTTTKNSINAKGKFILPGFWDNHTHFRGGDSLIGANKNLLKLFIANGITTVRDAGGDLTSAVLKWRKQIASNSLTGPTIFTSGPKIDGPNGTWAGSLEVENEQDILKALDSLQAIPTDFVKLYDSRISGEAYLKTIAEAENRNLITSGHMPFTVELNDAVGAGIDAIEHLYYIMKGCSSKESEITEQLQKKELGFWQAMPLLMETFNDTTALALFENLKQNNVYVVPTLHIGKTLSYLDEIDHSKDLYLKYMGDAIIKTYEGRINRVKKSAKKTIADRKALDAFFGKLTKLLSDAKVNILAGSDSGAYNSYTYSGISLHQELKEMVANGLTPLEALRTSAPNGAKFLKQNANYGAIEKGKISDLVILDKNPLENISNTQKIYAVIKGNKSFSKEDLKLLLND